MTAYAAPFKFDSNGNLMVTTTLVGQRFTNPASPFTFDSNGNLLITIVGGLGGGGGTLDFSHASNSALLPLVA